MMSSPIKVMLVDDHAVVRAGYRTLLAQAEHIEVIAEAVSGEQACQLYATVAPDVVVMDLSMPGIGGLAAIRRLLARDARARILVFSIHDEPVYVSRALEAGAQGYISKASAPDILLDAVLSLAAGECYVEPALAQRLVVNHYTTADAQPGVLSSLSAREFDVFCRLARGYTTRQVAEDLRISYKTAANYATTIRAKLNLATSADMARLAFQHGLLPH